MSITARRSAERGYADHGWLKSFHTFSFANYHDPRFKSFASLCVINEDTVGAGGGFPNHGHRDAEIYSYVLTGGLEHKDSMGNAEVLRPGDVQFTSAGTGIQHSEANAEKGRAGPPVRFLQIWATPSSRSLTPGYQTGVFPAALKVDKLLHVLAPAPLPGQGGAAAAGATTAAGAAANASHGDRPLLINADFNMHASILGPGATISRALTGVNSMRRAYVHVPIMPGASGLLVQGTRADGASVPPVRLAPGDGAFVQNVDVIAITGLGGPGELQPPPWPAAEAAKAGLTGAAVVAAAGPAAAAGGTEFVLFDMGA